MKNYRLYFFSLLSLVVVLACTTLTNIIATPTPVPVNTPFPSPTPVPTLSSNVLFEDGEFTNSCVTGGTDSVDRFVENGQFMISVADTSIVAWAECTTDQFDDFVLEVDASQVSGPDNNIYGVLFRYDTDVNEFYVFAISGDGYYVLAVDGPDRSDPEMLMEWTPSPSINLGNATNHIKVEAIGSRIAFYVNDQYLGEAQDSRLATGVVGFFVGTIDNGGIQIGYDNLKITSP
ncbi:MAG: hypothetical protein HYU84_17900 [Chloroflexi bacterium]|nr:hypothetical protein [Chloroflexota bacterium]